MNSKYPYILAIIFGLTVPFFPEMKPFPIILGLIYFFGGSLFGFLWPKISWLWGIWIGGPMFILLGLSVLFTGQMEMFLQKDLPMLVVPLTTSCLGAFISARFKTREKAGS